MSVFLLINYDQEYQSSGKLQLVSFHTQCQEMQACTLHMQTPDKAGKHWSKHYQCAGHVISFVVPQYQPVYKTISHCLEIQHILSLEMWQAELILHWGHSYVHSFLFSCCLLFSLPSPFLWHKAVLWRVACPIWIPNQVLMNSAKLLCQSCLYIHWATALVCLLEFVPFFPTEGNFLFL